MYGAPSPAGACGCATVRVDGSRQPGGHLPGACGGHVRIDGSR
jgi:hypothetical protein